MSAHDAFLWTVIIVLLTTSLVLLYGLFELAIECSRLRKTLRLVCEDDQPVEHLMEVNEQLRRQLDGIAP